MAVDQRDVVRLPHHEQQEFCLTRAKYRQGKKLRAVKVYTINDESQHLLVCGVPALGLQDDLKKLCSRFGDVKSLVYIPKYSEEEFADAYHVQYIRIQSARYAKHHIDGKSFFGGTLHVCYAPEMESVAETRTKLIQRRKDVAKRIKGRDTCLQEKTVTSSKQYHRQKKHPALPITAERLAAENVDVKCIWQGIPRAIDPRTISPAAEILKPSTVYGPHMPDSKWLEAGVKETRILTRNSVVPTTKVVSATSISTSSTKFANVSQALRFIPRQVNLNKRIIFRNNRSNTGEKVEKEESHKRSLDDASLSVEETILSVRKKIRAVAVPNVQVVLDSKNVI